MSEPYKYIEDNATVSWPPIEVLLSGGRPVAVLDYVDGKRVWRPYPKTEAERIAFIRRLDGAPRPEGQ